VRTIHLALANLSAFLEFVQKPQVIQVNGVLGSFLRMKADSGTGGWPSASTPLPSTEGSFQRGFRVA
jgi:hypothetical protein